MILKKLENKRNNFLNYGSSDKFQGTTRHYIAIATDCRRSMLSSRHSNDLLHRRASGLSASGSSECHTNAAASSSFGSFGGNDADHEDNVSEDDRSLNTKESIDEENGKKVIGYIAKN